MARIAIAGHPRSGKSHLAMTFPGPHYATDSLLAFHPIWEDHTRVVSLWFDLPNPWVISGVKVCHALRAWRDTHPGEPPPLDQFFFIRRPTLNGLTRGQVSMALGIDTVFSELQEWLESVTRRVPFLISL